MAAGKSPKLRQKPPDADTHGDRHTARTSSHPGRALASLLPPDIPNYDLERTKMDVLAKSLFSNSTKIRTFGRRKVNRGCAAFAGF